MTSRVSPVPDPSLLAPEDQALLSRLGYRGEKNIFRTLIRFPAFLRAMLPLATHCAQASELSPRLREVAILRTAWRGDCEYEWAQHDEAAARAGLSAGEIEAVAIAPIGFGWGPAERLVLESVDALFDLGEIPGRLWTDWRDGLGEQALVDLIALCGFYRMLGAQLRSLGVELEPGQDGYSATLRAARRAARAHAKGDPAPRSP